MRLVLRSSLLVFVAVMTSQVLSAAKEDEQANRLYQSYFEEYLKLNPLKATLMGELLYKDKLVNPFSADYQEASLALEQRYLKKLKSLSRAKLKESEALNYDWFLSERELAVAKFQFDSHLLPLLPEQNIIRVMAYLGSGAGPQPFNSVNDYEQWYDRLSQLPPVIAHLIVNLKQGVKKGVVLPRPVAERVLGQVEVHLVETTENSVFYRPVTEMPRFFKANQKQYVIQRYSRLIDEKIIPSLLELTDYLKQVYLPATRDSLAWSALPQGDKWYRHRIKSFTSSELPPESIHELGLSEVERILNEIDSVKSQLKFEGNRKELFDEARSDKYLFESADEILKQYKAFAHQVNLKTPALFNAFPTTTYEIKTLDSQRTRISSIGWYQPPSTKGLKPGIFWLNTVRYQEQPKWKLASYFLSQVAPGNHFLFGLQPDPEEIPKFRQNDPQVAFQQGWGLYAESLGKTLGVYQDPLRYYGFLLSDLMHSSRLVIDTGVHSKGWTQEKAENYLVENTHLSPQQAKLEVDRVVMSPARLLSPKLGQIKFINLKQMTQQKLGDEFDIKVFHGEVLKHGEVPLWMLQKNIERWIDRVARKD